MGYPKEKLKPTHDLTVIQAVVANPTSRPFTKTALDGGRDMGLKERDMRDIVLGLSRRNFYKSVPFHYNHQWWQDVYHGKTLDGTIVYIKVTLDADRVVIQFKAK